MIATMSSGAGAVKPADISEARLTSCGSWMMPGPVSERNDSRSLAPESEWLPPWCSMRIVTCGWASLYSAAIRFPPPVKFAAKSAGPLAARVITRSYHRTPTAPAMLMYKCKHVKLMVWCGPKFSFRMRFTTR